MFASSATLVCASEVAWVMCRAEDYVAAHRPTTAYKPGGGRAIVAPFREWLAALGYAQDGAEVPEPPPDFPGWAEIDRRRATSVPLKPLKPMNRKKR